MAKQNNQNGEQQCHKKQVRRRLQTSRPYQDRLLNMAEARKEIVTALKFHRASMRKANEKNQQPQPQTQSSSNSLLVDQHSQYRYNRSILGVQNENSCESRSNISPLFTTIPCDMAHSSGRISNDDISNHVSNYHPSTSTDPPTIYKTLDIPLPPLGLNLNLQAITNLCTTSMNTSTSSSPSSSSWIPTNRAPTTGVGQVGPSTGMDQVHQALDDVEIAKVRSIGEKHHMEWDDTLDSVKTNRWFKLLKSLDLGRDMKGVENNEHDDSNNEYHENPFGDESMEFPSWLSGNDNEEGFLKQHLDDQYLSTNHGKDDALPWVDIGDIDGLDDEWLS